MRIRDGYNLGVQSVGEKKKRSTQEFSSRLRKRKKSLSICLAIARIIFLEKSAFLYNIMPALADKEGPLPRFGEWDVNDPATAEGFSEIFTKASNDKKAAKASGNTPDKKGYMDSVQQNNNYRRKWLCCIWE